MHCPHLIIIVIIPAKTINFYPLFSKLIIVLVVLNYFEKNYVHFFFLNYGKGIVLIFDSDKLSLEFSFIHFHFLKINFDSILFQTNLSCFFLQFYQLMKLFFIILDFRNFYRDQSPFNAQTIAHI